VDMVLETEHQLTSKFFQWHEPLHYSTSLSIWRILLNFNQAAQNSDIKRSHHKIRSTHAVMQQPVQTVMLMCILCLLDRASL